MVEAVDNLEEPGRVTGTINANPNPIFLGQSCVISWDMNDPAGAEVRVFSDSGAEKLVTRGGKFGHIEIPWITNSTTYEFRLYAASRPDMLLDSVKTRLQIDSAATALRQIADEVSRGNIATEELSRFIAAVIPNCLRSAEYRQLFQDWERHGFHITPVHFYQPIPDTNSLPETLWSRTGELRGINMNDAVQLDLLQNHFPKFRNEYEDFPVEPPPGQKRPFRGVDALVAYCMVRHFQPQVIIEIGSGFSSLVLGQAAAKNKNSALVCVDPFPPEFLRKGIPALRSLTEAKVQDVGVEFFAQLGPGDILFIDTSHTVKIGGDVNYLFLEVLPRIKPGVIVHVHDIFLPFEYRRDWVMDEFRFWTEQYLLQAFLTFNRHFEVLMANYYLGHYFEEQFKSTFPGLESVKGGSFWMRRKSADPLARRDNTPVATGKL